MVAWLGDWLGCRGADKQGPLEGRALGLAQEQACRQAVDGCVQESSVCVFGSSNLVGAFIKIEKTLREAFFFFLRSRRNHVLLMTNLGC